MSSLGQETSVSEWMNRGRVLDAQIYRLQSEYIDVLIQLVDAISQLDDRRERIALYEYYCNCRTWAEVASILELSYQQTLKVKASALEKLSNGKIITEKRR